MNLLVVLIAALILGVTTCGCSASHQYRVTIRAASEAAPPAGTSYVLLPGDEEVPSDPSFDKYAGFAREMLGRRHYIQAGDLSSADLAIFFTYGLRLTLAENHAEREAKPPPVLPVSVTVQWPCPGSSWPSSFIPVRTPGILTGVRPAANPYRRFLRLRAVKAGPYNDEHEMIAVWSIEAVSVGYQSDMGNILPAMIAACEPFIGTTVRKKVTVIVSGEGKQRYVVRERAGQDSEAE